MDGILNRILGLPKGSPGLGEALNLIAQRRRNDYLDRETGGHPIGRQIPTRFATVEDTGDLNDLFVRAQMEDAYRMADERIKATTPQRWQPEMAPAQEFNPVGSEVQLYDGPNVAPQQGVLGAQYNPQDFGQFGADWYSSVGHPQSAEKASLIASKAAEYGMDPYMALALAAQEGGWARYHPSDSPNNYFGWGVTDSGDMGLGSQDLGGWLDTYIPQIVDQYGSRDKLVDWGGSLQGLGEGSPYTARYNYNDSWVKALSDLVNQANNFRQERYPNLPGPSINVSY